MNSGDVGLNDLVCTQQRGVEFSDYENRTVAQGFKSLSRLKGDHLAPLVYSGAAQAKGPSDRCLCFPELNGGRFSHATYVNSCLRASATSVYGRVVNLCVQMSTQHDRIKQMLAETGTDWDDIRTAARLTRAGIKKWRDGAFKRLESKNIFILAELFGCAPRWLAEGDGDAFPAADMRFKELLTIWRQATREGRDDMVKHARYVASQSRFRTENEPPGQSAADG